MSNLEQLGLYLPVCVDKTFINGNYLNTNIIHRMPRLNQFTFYFCSYIFICNEMNFPSTEDIQHTFIDFPIKQIISYGDYFPEAKQCRFHVYSYPFLMPYYGDITNNFPGGLFTYVRKVSLFDEHPFEHEFFLRIEKSFPFMEQLFLRNEKAQNRKLSNNDHRNLSVINYSCLNKIGLSNAHDDYIEQFLCDNKTYLPNNVILCIDYESLQRVTHNFTRDATRINCAKISKLKLSDQSKRSNSLEEYFPCAQK
jgi:hypothetical protein